MSITHSAAGPLLSVIITVYNSEKYLRRCLNSVISQYYPALEIIVVNDGSRDSSLQIIMEFASIDHRIAVISQENAGAAQARKSGLEIATGEYVHYLDSDDYLELDAYSVWMAKAISSHADLLLLDFWFEQEATGELQASIVYDKQEYTSTEYLTKIFERRGYFALWAYLHKRTLYQFPISYPESLVLGEDAYLTSQLVYYATRIIAVSNTPRLHYVLRQDSISNGVFSVKMKQDLMDFPALIDSFFRNKEEYAALSLSISNLRIQCMNDIIYSAYNDNIKEVSHIAVEIFRKFPLLHKVKAANRYYKLYALWHSCPFLGSLYAAYYRRKKKIK